jgi:dCMP deaminase
MIIGITGTLGAGKGTVVDFLQQRGFKHYSVREFLIDEINKRGLPVNRDSMVLVANQLREMNSPSYIVEQLFEKAKSENSNVIIESIRTPGEAEKINALGGTLLAVDADPKLRYSRILARQSETDNISFNEFLEDEKREMFSSDPNKQNLSRCIQIANYVLENNKDFQNIYKQVEEILEKIKHQENPQQETKQHVRPSWDEYFMKIVHVVSERGTCDRGRTAVIAVKDRRVIATGYVGSPVGLPHCYEVGHLLHKVINDDGTTSQHCIRTIHGEQNVICQAARFGISLNGATMYMKLTPCFVCAKMIINAGIKRVVAEKKYHRDVYSLKALQEAGVQVDILNEEVEKYENM